MGTTITYFTLVYTKCLSAAPKESWANQIPTAYLVFSVWAVGDPIAVFPDWDAVRVGTFVHARACELLTVRQMTAITTRLHHTKLIMVINACISTGETLGGLKPASDLIN